MSTEMLKKYADLKIQEASIKEELKDLNPKVIQFMVEADVEKQPTSLGMFSLVPLKDWTYSPEYEKAKEDLKGLKKDEEKDGTATFTEKLSLRFKESKNE